MWDWCGWVRLQQRDPSDFFFGLPTSINCRKTSLKVSRSDPRLGIPQSASGYTFSLVYCVCCHDARVSVCRRRVTAVAGCF